MKKANAFTLIELLAAIVIIGTISTICIISFIAIKNKTLEKNYLAKIKLIETAAYKYGYANKDDIWDDEKNFEGKKYECVSIEKLIMEGYLTSDEENRLVIINPINKEPMTEGVTIKYENQKINLTFCNAYDNGSLLAKSSFKTCPHEKCGCQEYETCVDESCECLEYESCPVAQCEWTIASSTPILIGETCIETDKICNDSVSEYVVCVEGTGKWRYAISYKTSDGIGSIVGNYNHNTFNGASLEGFTIECPSASCIYGAEKDNGQKITYTIEQITNITKPDESCGCKTRQSCPNRNCECKTFESCAIEECGYEN